MGRAASTPIVTRWANDDITVPIDDADDLVKVYCKPSECYYDNYLLQELDSFICGQYISRTSE